jgi:ABC-type uncharacterized transport system auxiliary subunit
MTAPFTARTHLLCSALLLCVSGCALLGKGKPLALRYFDLEASEAYRPTKPAQTTQLRLGSVSAARHIDRRFVSRRSAHELTYYDEWRFTDQPQAFLERTLAEDLFERAGLTRVVSGLAPTLEVELLSFEERTGAGRSKAHLSALAVMHDDRVQLWQRRFEVEREVGAGDAAEALAAALSRVLSEVAIQISEETLAVLSRSAGPEAASP